MKPALRILITAAVASAGILLGRHYGGSQEAKMHRAADDGSSMRATKKRHESPASPKDGERPMNLQNLKERLSAATKAIHQNRELERLSPAQLRKLIEDLGPLLTDSGKETEDAAGTLIYQALKELYRREGLAAVEWVAMLPEGRMREQAFKNVICEAAFSNPVSAKPWIDRLREEYGKDAAMSPIAHAIGGATQRGAAALVELTDLYGKDTLRQWNILQGSVPADFDFDSFYRGVVGRVNLRTATQVWAARDKVAAWQAVKQDLAERGAPASQYFGSMMNGVISADGETQAIGWGVAALKELPPDQRELCLGELCSQHLSAESINSTSKLLEPSDRELFAAKIISITRGSERVQGVLETLDREQLLRVLEKTAAQHREELTPEYDPNSSLKAMFQTAARKFSLTPEERAKIGY